MRKLLTLALVLLAAGASAQTIINLPTQRVRLRPNPAAQRTWSLGRTTQADPRIAEIGIRITRPRTIDNGETWDDQTKISVVGQIVLDDTRVYEVRGGATGGIREDKSGAETDYTLRYTPPWGFFGGETTKRVGETANSKVEYALIVTLESGNEVDTHLDAWVVLQDAPDITPHNSVGFDAASGTEEQAGDKYIEWSHSSGGSDRAAFLTQNHQDNGTEAGMTYNSVSATKIDDTEHGSYIRHAIYYITGQATGTQTVSATISGGSTYSQDGFCISMTGVDSSDPVGTFAEASSGSGNPSVTASDGVAAGNMVVDSVSSDYRNGTVQTTDGVDTPDPVQTQVQNQYEDNSFLRLTGSYQDGGDGGEMAWSYSGGVYYWVIGWHSYAVAFQAAGGAPPAATPQMLLMGVGP